MSNRVKEFLQLLDEAGLPDNLYSASRKTHVSFKLLEPLAAGKLPSNHPYIPHLAQTLKIDEGAIRSFAQGKPMGGTEARRLATRLENSKNGTSKSRPTPSPAAAAAREVAHQNGVKAKNPGQRFAAMERDRREAEKTKNPLMLARLAKQMSSSQFGEVSGVSVTTIRTAERGHIAPNSPVLARLAPLYGLPLEKMAAHMTRKPMPDWAVRNSHHQTGVAKKRSSSNGLDASNGKVSRNGTGFLGHAELPKKTRSVLKKMDVSRRESLRTLTNTCNYNAMKGAKETAIPTQMLADFLREYYAAIGVEGHLVLDAVFDRVFD